MTRSEKDQRWIDWAERLFQMEKPDNFTDLNHCDECDEHNGTLKNSDVKTIGMDQLGSPAWDPICFCSVEGKLYYTPAFIRLSLDTIEEDFYLDQFLFHLIWDGDKNKYYQACSLEQRKFIASFLTYMLENHSAQLEDNFCDDNLLQAHQIWSK